MIRLIQEYYLSDYYKHYNTERCSKDLICKKYAKENLLTFSLNIKISLIH